MQPNGDNQVVLIFESKFMSFPAPPDPFLSVVISDLTLDPTLCTLCAGYEGGQWRSEDLAEHAMEWLPEFCLSADELSDLN